MIQARFQWLLSTFYAPLPLALLLASQLPPHSLEAALEVPRHSLAVLPPSCSWKVAARADRPV